METLKTSLKSTLQSLAHLINIALQNIRVTAEIILVVALLVAGWAYNRKVAQLSSEKDKYATLASNLQSQITIRDNQIKILSRKKDGKVEVHTIYVPQEGGTVVTHSTGTNSGNPTPPGGTSIDTGNGQIVYIKTKGATFKPGFGFDFDGVAARPYLDAKLAYWSRYSAGAGASTGGIGVFASRHMDDILWTRPQNVELFVAYRVFRFKNGGPVIIGIRSNF